MVDVVKRWFARFLSDEEAILLTLILLIGAVVIMAMGQILAPLLISIVLAYVMQGLIKLMRTYRLPSSLAIVTTFLLFLGGFGGLLFFVIPRVWRQLRNLFNELPNMLNHTQDILTGLPIEYPALISQGQINTWIESLNADAGQIGQWLLSFSLAQLPTLVTMAVYMVLVPILVFFILKDQNTIIQWCWSFLPDKRPLISGIAAEMDVHMAKYIRGKVVEIIVVGIATYAVFAAYELNYAVLLAFLVGLSVIVPYLGIMVVTLPILIIGYLQFGWSETYFYLIAWHSLLQALDGFVFVPLLFSEAVNLHPIAIITAVLVFGSWWGIGGVFFAIPLATLIKVLITSWPRTQKIGAENAQPAADTGIV